LKKKTVLITGISKGMGKAIGESLQVEGHTVIGISRTPHPEIPTHLIDLSDIRRLPNQLKALEKDLPPIDTLICNAGRGVFGNLEEISHDEIKMLLHLNLLSQIYLTKTFLPGMKRQKEGDILYICSVSGIQGKMKGSIYSASKFGLRGFAQSIREECMSSNIRVTQLHPGFVTTSFFDHLNFAPGDEENAAIPPVEIARLVCHILAMPRGSVVDEMKITPQIRSIKKD